jgi:AAA15 family ATPase/GTPase
MKFCHKNGKDEIFTNARFLTKNGGIQNQIDNEYAEILSALYLPANLYDQNISNDISNIIKNNRKDLLLTMLKEFDEKIFTVESLPEGVFVGYDNIDGLMPVSMLGDGLRRYLCIVAAITNPNNKILFLDEIDNGIHYSSYEDLWRNVFGLAKKFQKQIFITTHSREVLFSLNNVLKSNEDYQSSAGLYTIEKTVSGDSKAYRYSYKGLKQAFENNLEIRSLL